MRLSLFFVSLVTLALGVPAPAASQNYYTDVRPVLAENGMGCHADNVIAMVSAWRDAGYPMGEPRPDPELQPSTAHYIALEIGETSGR
ncbi:MAG: hypothetical protein HKO98_04260 [Gemmatimonadetes bacterium]|nr:hypothetical protein [Gemmatimonadota bacterium]